MKPIVCVVLAAGLGTRMKSDRAKVLHPILGRPMLHFPLAALKPLKPAKISVVVGHQADRVREAFAEEPRLVFARQEKQLGTADALRAGLLPLGRARETLLVMNGDMPLVTTEMLRLILKTHRRQRNGLTIATFIASGPSDYGRVIRSSSGGVTGVVEKKDATAEQLAIREVNGGVYVIEPPVLALLKRIRPANKAGEFYLTDLIGLAVEAGHRVGGSIVREEELYGVNSRAELAHATAVIRRRILDRLMTEGVTIIDPASVMVGPEVRVGRDTIIYPGVILEGRTSVGRGSVLYPGSRIIDSVLDENVTVKDMCVIEESRVGPDSVVGPFAHFRPGNVLKRKVKVGNFVELKKAVLMDGAKASHLSYLGDAVIGRQVNIGAGTITCNYDGRHKHLTTIEDGVFIGSDTQLVAPVTIGRGAYVGAGSTITTDVPPGALAITRVRQRHIENWSKNRADRPAKPGKKQGSK